MKREIKFRGKRIDNGQWERGDVLQGDEFSAILIGADQDNSGKIILDYAKVDPETLGQFTGKRDSHDIGIYEGDILQDVFDGKKDQFVVKWHDYSFALFSVDDDRYKGSPDYMQDNLEIIGTIHDQSFNPTQS